MSSVIDFAAYVDSAIAAGEIVEGNVVRVIADNGATIGEAVAKEIVAGNGTAATVYTMTQAGGTGPVATGLAYLAMDLGVAGAAIAPALGILAGVGLYSLAPEFWTNVSNTLVEAGKTIGGKLIGYWNGENLYYDEDTIEIFKNAFIEAGVYDGQPELEPGVIGSTIYTKNPTSGYNNQAFSVTGIKVNVTPKVSLPLQGGGFANVYYIYDMWDGAWGKQMFYVSDYPLYYISFKNVDGSYGLSLVGCNYAGNIHTPRYNFNPDTGLYALQSHGYTNFADPPSSVNLSFNDPAQTIQSGLNNLKKIAKYWVQGANVTPGPFTNPEYSGQCTNNNRYGFAFYPYFELACDSVFTMIAENVQEGAVLPSDDPFPQTYPDWYPLEYPQTLPDPGELPTIYPIKYPGIGPDAYPTQDPAQNPDAEPVPEVYPVIIPDFNIPDPGIPTPPEPEPDPDPQPEPDPIPEDPDPEPEPDPIDPNPEPTPSVPIVVPSLPDTVNSSKLFTVYNPTSSQLDALGGYLWDASIIAAIRDIWQEPMDGLISLQQVFVTPSTSGSHNIILGFLDSGVSANVVSNQFVTVDCGTVSVNERKNNATDYAPYTSLHLYLPFIGIVELDTNECMDADISVKYKVDVYTGTCLAQVSVDREADMPNDPILYTFSGNCSQQLPLTSGNSTGVLSALLAGVGVGVSVASGGGLSTVAGYHLAGSSLTHEMMHVSHSGNISANAGIMGQKKPYLIIGRRHGYDANNYNSFYGYPANKTVFLGNHTGFAKVKSCWIRTSATQPEYEEIMKLLEEGVFV